MPKPTKLPKPWKALVDAYGGRRAFADLMEVSESTVYRWAHHMSGMSKATVNEIIRLAKKKGLHIEQL